MVAGDVLHPHCLFLRKFFIPPDRLPSLEQVHRRERASEGTGRDGMSALVDFVAYKPERKSD